MNENRLKNITSFGIDANSSTAYIDYDDSPTAITIGPNGDLIIGIALPTSSATLYGALDGSKMRDISSRPLDSDTSVLTISFKATEETVAHDIGVFPSYQAEEVRNWLNKVRGRFRNRLPVLQQ